MLVVIRSLTVTDTDDPGRLPSTHRSDYPNVAEWLDGVDSSHWWVRLLDTERDRAATPPTLADLVLGPLEILVQAVRGASPVRLGELVNRFRDPDPANLLSARLELLCAANMAFRHVPFELGGRAEPDLTWNPGTGAQGSVEIHRGAFSVFDDLQQALDRELQAKGAVLTVRLGEWPLDVRDRNLLHTRISNAIDVAIAGGSSQVVAMPELGDGATGVIEPRPENPGISGIFVQHAGITPSEGYLASARRAAGAEGQRGQGRPRPERQLGSCTDSPADRHLHRAPCHAPRPGWSRRMARQRAGRLGRPAICCGGGVLQQPPRLVLLGELPVPARPEPC